jgi:hypothetical protein
VRADKSCGQETSFLTPHPNLSPCRGEGIKWDSNASPLILENDSLIWCAFLARKAPEWCNFVPAPVTATPNYSYKSNGYEDQIVGVLFAAIYRAEMPERVSGQGSRF